MLFIEPLKQVEVFFLIVIVFLDGQHKHAAMGPNNQVTCGSTSEPQIALYLVVIVVALSVVHIQTHRPIVTRLSLAKK